MINQSTRSLLPLLFILFISACGGEGKGPDIVDINGVVDQVDTSDGSDNGGGGIGGASIAINNPCGTVYSIGLMTTFSGALTIGDCILSDFISSSDSSLVDGYLFVLDAQVEEPRITMRSTDFDTFLLLRRCSSNDCSSNVAIAANNNGGNGTNSEITLISLAAGTYLILANSNSVDNSLTGSYTLETELQSAVGIR